MSAIERLNSSIDRQFTPEFVSKAVVEQPTRKRFFSKLGKVSNMPDNHGDTFTMEVKIPVFHPENIIDGNVDASTAELIKNVFYAYDANGVLIGTFDANDYLGDSLGDATAARAAAQADAEGTTGVATVKAGAGTLLYANASFSLVNGPIVPLGEDGGVINLINSRSKLISAKVGFHGTAVVYTTRSMKLDSRVKLLAQKIKDLSRATAEMQEMQAQHSILAAAEVNTMIASATATSKSQMTSADLLTWDALEAFEMDLRNNDVPMQTEIITGVAKLDTVTVDEAWPVYVHQSMIPTLRSIKGPGDVLLWEPRNKYAAGTTLLDGEIGAIGNFRFISVPDMQVYKGLGGKVDDDSADAAVKANRWQSGGYYDVFPLVVVGDDAHTTVKFNGSNVTAEHVKPTRDVHNDLYKSKGAVVSEWTYGMLVYRPERIKSLLAVSKKISSAL
jgi:N4-gp56 family major capsid protein